MARRILHVLPLVLLLAFQAASAWAASSQTPQVDTRDRMVPLLEALGLPELLEIMRAEGLDYAGELEADLFPGRGGTRWPEMVARIYDLPRMSGIMIDEISAGFDPEHIEPLSDFFASPLGARIVALEISARRALLDPSVEAASAEALERMADQADPRLELLEAFETVNDLVERNVMGALNANFAFYTGLNAGGAFSEEMTEADMLRDVWAQEADLRAETDIWLRSYLAMAYQPLSDEEIEAYVELSGTPHGRALNAALFAAFDVLFRTISRDLGMAAAQFMAGEDL